MRKLKTRDVPALCRCLKKLGLKEDFRKIAAETDDEKTVWDKGFDLIWGLFDKATEGDGEGALYEFLAGPFEMTPAEVEDLDLSEMISGIKQLAAENNLGDFFKFAARSMK